MQHECNINATLMQHECIMNATWMQHECNALMLHSCCMDLHSCCRNSLFGVHALASYIYIYIIYLSIYPFIIFIYIICIRIYMYIIYIYIYIYLCVPVCPSPSPCQRERKETDPCGTHSLRLSMVYLNAFYHANTAWQPDRKWSEANAALDARSTTQTTQAWRWATIPVNKK